MSIVDMGITNAKYEAFEGSNVAIKAAIYGDEVVVPLDTANRHFAEILRQLEAGELTIADAD